MPWESAVAIVEIESDGKWERSGTAFLVTPQFALTALHVVGDRSAEPVRFLQGKIRLTFPGHSSLASVYQERYDRMTDWVLLQLDKVAPFKPLLLSPAVKEDAKWKSRGFPDASPKDGMGCDGTVTLINHTIAGVRTLQLFCQQAAAADGLPIKGLSGAPVLVGEFVVGILRRALLRTGTELDLKDVMCLSRGGTLFACPVQSVLDRCADLLPATDSISDMSPVEDITTEVVLHMLPSIDNHFVGRVQQLEELNKAWNTRKLRMVILRAWGGAGKTAIVSQWIKLFQLSGFKDVRYIFAWSFNSQGHSQSYETAEPFIRAALKWFDPADRLDGDLFDQAMRLCRLMRRGRTLLILDGLERIQYPPGEHSGKLKDKALLAILRELINFDPKYGLCIVTTREKLPELESHVNAVRVIPLDQLSNEDGAALLQKLDVKLDHDRLCAISANYRGHCLSLSLVGHYMRKNPESTLSPPIDDNSLENDQNTWRQFESLMNSYESWIGNTVEWTVLRLFGYLDRPADYYFLSAFRQVPSLLKVTNLLFHQEHRKRLLGLLTSTIETPLNNYEWTKVVDRLRELGLIAPKRLDDATTLDAHPLIREYFARKLKADPALWVSGHSRLYIKLGEVDGDVREEGPKTIEDIIPTYYAAIRHGCLAGLHQHTLDHLYVRRILRGSEFYDLRRLGAFDTNLSILSFFFDRTWDLPVDTLSENGKGFVLNMAGFCLRSLGQPQEALIPMVQAHRVFTADSDTISAVGTASNLIQTYHLLGRLENAYQEGIAGLKLIDSIPLVTGQSRSFEFISARITSSSKDNASILFWKMGIRSDTAAVLHQMGRIRESEKLFLEAEAIQAKRQPEHPLLYSLPGYWYCDLLLTKAEEFLRAGNDTKSMALTADVKHRSATSLKWIETALGTGRLDHGLHHLSMGKAYLLESSLNSSALAVASKHLLQALDSLRSSGHYDFLAIALHAVAELSFANHYWKHAADFLREALQLTSRCGMRLQEADTYLLLSKMYNVQGQMCEAKLELAKATCLIQELSYRRRDPMLELLGRVD